LRLAYSIEWLPTLLDQGIEIRWELAVALLIVPMQLCHFKSSIRLFLLFKLYIILAQLAAIIIKHML
jgi:hypothetical protein